MLRTIGKIIKFEEADRILYQLDKKYNKDISIHKAVKEE